MRFIVNRLGLCGVAMLWLTACGGGTGPAKDVGADGPDLGGLDDGLATDIAGGTDEGVSADLDRDPDDGSGRDSASEAEEVGPSCTSGAKRCDGNQPQACDGEGTWHDSAACVNQACVDGVCQGECEPGSARCSGPRVQNCNASGEWGEPDSCIATSCVVEEVGVFVAPLSLTAAGSEMSCGLKSTPCATIGEGLLDAVAAGKAYVFLAAGTYVEDNLVLPDGMTLLGGFEVSANDWSRPCPADASRTVIQPAASGVTIRFETTSGSARLDSLTLRSKPQPDVGHDVQGQDGETLYGILARGTAAAILSLDNVVLTLSDGGRGGAGSAPTGAGVADEAGSCTPGESLPVADGAAGDAGAGALEGSFTDQGYQPGDGGNGAMALAGQNGLVNTDFRTASGCGVCTGISPSCNRTTLSLSGGHGLAGCGGRGGGGGGGGSGGGSSIGLFAWGLKVKAEGGSISAGAGGDGGDGIPGAAGGSPSTGIDGTDTTCYLECALQAVCSGPPPCLLFCRGTTVDEVLAGGTTTPAGQGGAGGQGGGGSGGWSYAVVALGGAVVETVDMAFSHLGPGAAGGGGAPTARDGQAGDTYP